MKPMTPREITAILRAKKQGAAIEINSLRNGPDSGWLNMWGDDFDFGVLAYRQKVLPIQVGNYTVAARKSGVAVEGILDTALFTIPWSTVEQIAALKP